MQRNSTNLMQGQPRVVVIGEAMIELSDRQVDTVRIGVAGDTFNTAVYLSRAGISVKYVTAVGYDAYSQKILDEFAAEGIETSAVARLKDYSAGLYAVDTDANGERSFTYWRSESAARSMLGASRVISGLTNAIDTELLFLSGITLSLFGREGREKIYEVMDCVRKKGGQVAFDPNYREKGWSDGEVAQAAIHRAVELSTITLPTFDDERSLFGDPTPEYSLARHKNSGVEEIVVKHGAAGALSHENVWVRPKSIVQPLDTTGAGDSFNAAYLAGRLKGESVEDSIIKGHELAARVLRCPGAILRRNEREV